jgi:predicted ATPase
MIHLKSVVHIPGGLASRQVGFPFDLPVIRSLVALDFTQPVTFFVGENGSGKSTLLEAIACAANLATAGAESVKTDKTLAHARALAAQLRLSWARRTHRGMFLRAEDFFGYVKRLAQTRAELERDLAAVEEEYKDRSAFARNQARMAYAGQLGEMASRYPRDLGSVSHGEGFIDFFQARFVPDGLYLLDEPEAPLSPIRQLAFLKLLMQMVEEGGQFIITTHSPIIMAYPGAAIYSFDGGAIQAAAYEELEHVRITRSFLNDPELFLRRLSE